MRVVGVVRAFEQTLVAPISGRTCVAYRSRVSVTVSPRPHGAPPLALSPKAESLLIAPFLIDRGAEGTVIVDGDQARFDLKPLELTAADAERKRSFLARHGYSSQGPVSGGSFTEVVLEPGMTIAVSGAMMRDVALAPPASDLAFREAPPATIRLTGNHEHPLVIGESKVMPR
ncbi:MAG: hypothetical protein JWP01_3081 [Myxococcales bacterium]|nr:hypothetical protein [Myxococcales bacterium]